MASDFRIRSRLVHEESAFSLIEVVIVLVIISVLAAIALPSFLNERAKGQDASAKANVRNALSHVESCYTTEQSYAECDDADDFAETGLRVTSAAPTGTEVQVTGSATGFTLKGGSRSGNIFEATKNGATLVYDCDAAEYGGCPSAGESGLSDWTSPGRPESFTDEGTAGSPASTDSEVTAGNSPDAGKPKKPKKPKKPGK